MAETTKIEWCDATFNHVIGCSKVHQGCANCYAERDWDKRRHHAKWGPNGTRVITSDENWKKPKTWNKKAEKEGRRMRVFCASLADVFEDWDGPISDSNGDWLHQCTSCRNPDGTFFQATTPPYDKWKKGYEHCCGEKLFQLTLDDVRRRLFALIDATPWLDWLLVTKRPENVRRMWADHHVPMGPGDFRRWRDDPSVNENNRHNVWLLTSVSEQATADKMVPELLKLRDLVPVLGLSIEPLLGPIDLRQVKTHLGHRDVLFVGDEGGAEYSGSRRNFLNWIIVGGESGPNARPMHPNWVRSLRDQAMDAGVPFFFKQWGEWLPQCNEPWQPTRYKFVHVDGRTFDRLPEHVMAREISGVGLVGKAAAGRLLDGRTWDEFPTVTKG